MDKAFKTMAVFTSVIMFLLMIAGTLVTDTDSGMGCGSDWPLCNGKFIPEYTVATMIEYTHRLITGFAGIVVIIFSIWAWRRYRGNREVKGLAILGISFIVVESLIGAAAVLWPQSAEVLALHFGFSLLAFTGVVLLSVFVVQKDRSHLLIKQSVSKRFKWFAWVTVAYAYLDIYSGAYLRHVKASLACTDFPGCYPGNFLPFAGLPGIHYLHRVAAVVLLALVLGLFIYSIRHLKHGRPDIFNASLLALILTLLQGVSGVAVVLSRLNIFATLSHSALITILFAVLFYIALQTTKRPEE
ncbi:COX15/CtaA family protein [Fictibacillus enclensis]|nr:heme A synthase [Fictibacillus enclensis]WHY72084.1 heme A synthase [Fictibacillus enclensis]